MNLKNISKNSALLLLCGFLVFSACNIAEKKQADLQAEVISVHDSVMAQMSKLMDNKLQINQLLNHLDSLKKVKPDLDTNQVRNTLTTVKGELVAADDAMMNWMHQFNPDDVKGSGAEMTNYLNTQKEKIYQVKKSFNEVLAKSDSVITKLK